MVYASISVRKEDYNESTTMEVGVVVGGEAIAEGEVLMVRVGCFLSMSNCPFLQRIQYCIYSNALANDSRTNKPLKAPADDLAATNLIC
ncbi:hypothetical protein L2E82_20391 [Cichorium intybus]|uniref:Uncharacterized protein n=1 Tax=Cichorium intybus TaxID=13427 RepID=A0ACB9DT78_CICIN|nr:hypothetical protein L2E82_20391 [Cichorium intybus]